MADTTPPAAAPARKRSRRGGCCLGLVVVALLVGFGALFGVRNWARSEAAELIAQEVPAESWDVELGLDTVPRLVLGLPFHVNLVGTNVQAPDIGRLPTLRLFVDGAVYSVGSGEFRQVHSVAFETLVSADAVAQLVRREALSAGLVQSLEVDFGDSVVTLIGTTDPATLGIPPIPGLDIGSIMRQLGDLRVTATARPRLEPPATLALDLQRVVVEPPAGLNLPALSEPIELSDRQRDVLSRDLVINLRDEVEGLQIDELTVEPAGLYVKGTLPPELLVPPAGTGTSDAGEAAP